jgi:hypothetical protein
LIFGQITKALLNHSLELKYFEAFSGFIDAAGSLVSSSEIGFLVPSDRVDDLRISPNEAGGKRWALDSALGV